MPIGFFTTLAAWIGVGVIEAAQRAKADKIARENPLPYIPKGLGSYDHWDANVLSHSSPAELREIFNSEVGGDPPAIKLMLKEQGFIDWECYKRYPLQNVIRHCCICGISEKRKYEWRFPEYPRCNYCDQRGISCTWQNNRKLRKHKSEGIPFVFID